MFHICHLAITKREQDKKEAKIISVLYCTTRKSHLAKWIGIVPTPKEKYLKSIEETLNFPIDACYDFQTF
jgi:hypothetical protein